MTKRTPPSRPAGGREPKTKIAVSLPASLVDAARGATRSGAAESVSAYVADALAQKVMADDLKAMLDQMLEETGGPMTDAERAEAGRILTGR